MEAGEDSESPRMWVPGSRLGARFLVGGLAVLTLVQISAVTGKNPVDAASYSLDFGAVYSDYGASLAGRTQGLAQQSLTLLRALVFPFGLVAFIAWFKKDRWVVVGFLAPMAVSSLLRGTDKEVVDILLCLLVAMYCHRMLDRRAVLMILAVPLAGALFVTRRLARFDDSLPPCLPSSSACFDYTSSVARAFGARAEIFSVFTTNYVTNGYEGLRRAFDLDWVPNFGVGHLPPVKRALCSATDSFCSIGDYQSTLTMAGWDSSSRWTSVYPVLANDLSFVLVPVYFAALGAVTAQCMRAWWGSRDPRGGAGLVLVTMFWVYSSANMQIAISLEWAVTTVVLLYIVPLRHAPRPVLQT